jgi:hypothetical protein
MIEGGLFASEKDLFRKMIIFYASISSDRINMTFDTSAIDTLTFRIIKRDLFPVLRRETAHKHFELEDYQAQAKDYIRELMDATPEERQYMDEFSAGRYRPELLFDDPNVIERIKHHPMALWKCRKV